MSFSSLLFPVSLLTNSKLKLEKTSCVGIEIDLLEAAINPYGVLKSVEEFWNKTPLTARQINKIVSEARKLKLTEIFVESLLTSKRADDFQAMSMQAFDHLTTPVLKKKIAENIRQKALPLTHSDPKRASNMFDKAIALGSSKALENQKNLQLKLGNFEKAFECALQFLEIARTSNQKTQELELQDRVRVIVHRLGKERNLLKLRQIAAYNIPLADYYIGCLYEKTSPELAYFHFHRAQSSYTHYNREENRDIQAAALAEARLDRLKSPVVDLLEAKAEDPNCYL